jgi:peroxin-13
MYGGFGNGFPGPYNGALAPSLTAGTQQGFALLHAVVQTVSGVAQMLESTFMATHASFTALVGVAEHFAHLRDALGSVLGLFGLLNWIRDTLRGRRANGPLQREFRQFASGQPPPPPPASKKPLLFFLAAALGVPWALSRLVRLLAERAAPQGALPPLAPSDLTFARAIHAFDPQSPSELALQPDTLVAITGRLDPRTGAEVDPRVPLVGEDGKEIEVEWWKGRTRDGREGWFPRRWVQILERRDPAKPAPVGGAVPPLSTDGEVKKVD